jgi:hypothetical protein
MSFESLLIHEIYLKTKYSSQNAFGEWEYSTSSATSTTKCRLRPLTAEELIQLSGRWEDVSYKGYFLSGANVNRGDEILHGTNSFRVKESYPDSSHHHVETLLVKL